MKQLFTFLTLTIMVSVANAQAGRIKVTFIGFDCFRETWDDILHTDGKGDEVYFNFNFAKSGKNGNLINKFDKRTQVYGDATGPFSNRISAGSMTDMFGGNRGGIKAGDQYRTQVVVGEMDLADGDFVVLSPTAWEHDPIADNSNAFFGTMASMYTTVTQKLAPIMLTLNALHGNFAGVIFNATQLGLPKVRAGGEQGELGRPGTRPIGMEKYGDFTAQFIALNSRTIQEFVNTDAGYGRGVISVNYNEELVGNSRDHGNYTILLKIEWTPSQNNGTVTTGTSGNYAPPPAPSSGNNGYVPPPNGNNSTYTAASNNNNGNRVPPPASSGNRVPPPPASTSGGSYVPPPPANGNTGGSYVPPPPASGNTGGAYVPPANNGVRSSAATKAATKATPPPAPAPAAATGNKSVTVAPTSTSLNKTAAPAPAPAQQTGAAAPRNIAVQKQAVAPAQQNTAIQQNTAASAPQSGEVKQVRQLNTVGMNKLNKGGMPVRAVNPAGGISGRWAVQSNDLGPDNVNFELMDNGEMVIRSANGTVTGMGRYSLNGNNFNANGTMTANNQAVSFTGTYNAATTQLSVNGGNTKGKAVLVKK